MSDLEPLAWGYSLIEGPRWDTDGSLYFSDVHNGGVHRLTPAGQVDTVVPKRRGVGGIALHERGGLVVSGRNVCHVVDGESRIVWTPDSPGLNDIFVDRQGRVLCGTMRSDPFTPGERIPGECWRVDGQDRATMLYDGVRLSNGIGFSPDGSVLYHSDTSIHGVWAHDYGDDGSVSGRRLLVQRDDLDPDGLAVDEEGVVWVADVSGSSSVRGFGPDGAEVDRIAVPARMVTSLCFGGEDRRDLYVVTGDNTEQADRKGTVFRTRAAVAGCVVPRATV